MVAYRDFFEDVEEFVKLHERIDELKEGAENIMIDLASLTHEEKDVIKKRLEEINNELDGLKESFDDDLEEKLDNIEEELDNLEDKVDDLEDEMEDLEDDFEDIKDDSINVNVNGKKFNFGKDFGNMFSNIFDNLFGEKKNTKVNKLVAALPFMNKEDLHELAEKIINNSEEYKGLSLLAIMPFLETRDCDVLFMKFVIGEKQYDYPLASLAPFVSKECLSKLVDEYVNGEYQDVEMSTLYPFLDSKDVKKVFNYILSKTEND